jgi:hypothetical protein
MINNPVPTQQFEFPTSHSQGTQNAQLKAAGKSANPPSTNPQAKSPATQGLPQVVSNVYVTKLNISVTQVKLSVSFTHNAGDTYFTQAQVFMKYGNAAPMLITSGSKSPITFNVARTKTAATVIVTSNGNWGSTPISQSPSKSVLLV